MIELKNVSKFYNDNGIVTVGLRNVSLKLNKGEFVAITGDSGSGKSTLLNVISSIDVYDEGEIFYYGNETFYFNQNDSDLFRKNNVSFIFQKYNIVDSYTVLQNVMLPLLIKGKSEEEAKAEALEIIKRVGLGHRVHNRGTKLSGGEKQRCVIARALATDAPILACDEPTGNLDKKTSEEIIKLIKEVSKDKLVLIVTHDYDSIKDVCTRKIKLSDGEVIEDIAFSSGEEEEKKELVLKDSKPAKKTLFKLSFLNIFSTPKKTIFSSVVFTFVSLVLMLLSLFMVQVSYEEGYSYSDRYGIVSDDRLIIYDSNHAPLDMNKLSSILEGEEYYVNAFYEEEPNRIEFKDFVESAALTFHQLDFYLIYGEKETKVGEYVIILPSRYSYGYYDSAIGNEITTLVQMDAGYNVEISIGKLVGVGVSSKVNQAYLYSSVKDESLANIFVNNAVTLSCSIKGSSIASVHRRYDKDAEKCYFHIPQRFKGNIAFDFNLKNLYGVEYDFEVVYSDDVSRPYFIVNKEYTHGEIAPKLNGVYEITVYTNNLLQLSRSIERLGYNVSAPSLVKNDSGASLIVLYLLIAVTIAVLTIMFYISFAILQRIYLTKTKDYSIFRTLGLVSKDLKKILYIEVVAITLTSILFGAVFANLVIIVAKIDLYKYFSGLLLLLYCLAMLVFGLLTANRLNSKIFNRSVHQALKEGVE